MHFFADCSRPSIVVSSTRRSQHQRYIKTRKHEQKKEITHQRHPYPRLKD